MKYTYSIILAVVTIAFGSCTVGKGCPSSGRNVGAERVLSADHKTQKAMKKAGKFRS